MSVRRAPPGPQVSTGRIRVDAAKAIAKLRAYRLADPTAWILEAVRAAVASGATRIALDGDADDVWLRWAGPGWPAAVVPDLLDELVSPEPARDAYHRRLLATAVNSALGLDPAWVDVIVIERGAARRVRFTPATVAEDTAGDTPLRDLAAAAVAVPEGAADCAVVVHLRRPSGLGVLSRFLRGDELPELTLARAACADIAVPMTIAGAAIGRATGGTDVLRLPLGEGLDGWIALVDPRATPAGGSEAVHVSELGVRITGQPWHPTTLGAGRGGGGAGAIPLRLVIDARRMPTNASRSQVAADQHPLAAALRRGNELVPALIERLAAEELTPARRDVALALVAAAAAGPLWADNAITLAGPLRTVAALPLLRNVLGAWRPVAGDWADPIHGDDEPLGPHLAPWLDTMLWLPPDDAGYRLLAGMPIDRAAARRHVKRARQRLRARERYRQRPVHADKLAERSDWRVVARLGAAVPASCVRDDCFTALSGEVGVVAAAGPGRVTLLFESRPLEVTTLDVPLAIDAVVASARLQPDDSYHFAVHDGERSFALAAARAGAIRALEVVAGSAEVPGVTVSAPRWRPEDAALIRTAIVMAWRDGHALDRDDSPLATAAVWPVVDGEPVSLATLRRADTIGVAAPDDDPVAMPGRPMVLATGASREALVGVLEPGTAVVPYAAAVARPGPDPAGLMARRVRAACGTATLVIREAHRSGAIGFAESSTVMLAHRGVIVETWARQPSCFDTVVALDSDELVPDASWKRVRSEGAATADLERWERALLHATAQALLGDPTPDLHLPARPLRLDDPTGRALCAAIAGNLLDVIGVDLATRLRRYPMLRMLGAERPVSIDELAAQWPGGTIAALSPQHVDAEVEALAADTWRPLVGDAAVRGLVQRLSGHPVVEGRDGISRRRGAAEVERKLAQHRARPADALTLPAGSSPIAIERGARGQVGVNLGPPGRLEVHIAFEGRRFSRLVSEPDLPLCAAVEVDRADLDHELTQLTEAARARVLAVVRGEAGAVLAAIARARPAELIEHAMNRRLLQAWLHHDVAREHGAVHEALRTAPMWPAIQGGRASIAAVTRGVMIPVATWSGTWLPGDPAHVLDLPVIALPEDALGDELRGLVDAIGRWPTDDVTVQVLQLQVARQIARGMVEGPVEISESAAEVAPIPMAEALPTPPRIPITIPTPEPKPTPEPRPTPTPEPTPEPKPKPTPEPEPTPKPTPKPEPEPEPETDRFGIPQPAQPHPLRMLAIRVRARLDVAVKAGVFVEHVAIAAGATRPLVAIEGNGVALAGDAPLLRDLADALEADLPRAPAGLDALVAHVITVMNVAHDVIADDAERVALGHLLARPG